ncbi:MAG: hypothetical protein AAF587_44910 [Bacteroidota bacterium]
MKSSFSPVKFLEFDLLRHISRNPGAIGNNGSSWALDFGQFLARKWYYFLDQDDYHYKKAVQSPEFVVAWTALS